MPHPISPEDATTPTETRRGRAWIDQAAGVRIGSTLAGISPGTSKTVLLIHGAPQTGHAWRKVVPILVAAGYQVVLPDYRGAGASTKPRDGYDKWTMAGDPHNLVRNELGVDGPISIVGHDLGSMVAFAYALRYRDDVVSLTTMEASLSGTDYYEQRKVAKSAWHFDFHANPDIAVYLTHGRERWYTPASSTISPTNRTRSARTISTSTPAPSKRRAQCARSARSTANSSTMPTSTASTSRPTASSPSPSSPPELQLGTAQSPISLVSTSCRLRGQRSSAPVLRRF
jgi:pimeloyl-ACP methyl ester carboxylesterase